MSDVAMNIQVPVELYTKSNEISIQFNTDLNTDMVQLMECYADSYQKICCDDNRG